MKRFFLVSVLFLSFGLQGIANAEEAKLSLGSCSVRQRFQRLNKGKEKEIDLNYTSKRQSAEWIQQGEHFSLVYEFNTYEIPELNQARVSFLRFKTKLNDQGLVVEREGVQDLLLVDSDTTKTNSNQFWRENRTYKTSDVFISKAWDKAGNQTAALQVVTSDLGNGKQQTTSTLANPEQNQKSDESTKQIVFVSVCVSQRALNLEDKKQWHPAFLAAVKTFSHLVENVNDAQGALDACLGKGQDCLAERKNLNSRTQERDAQGPELISAKSIRPRSSASAPDGQNQEPELGIDRCTQIRNDAFMVCSGNSDIACKERYIRAAGCPLVP